MKDLLDPKTMIPNHNGLTGDARLDKRAKLLWNQLSKTPHSSISALTDSRSEQVGNYRLLENENFTEQQIINELSSRVSGLVTCRHVLCPCDTSEINLHRNTHRLKVNSGLGRSDNADNYTCFKLHPSLVLDAKSYSPLGFSDIKVYHREKGQGDRFERNYKRQAIQGKESYKWIEVANNSKKVLSGAKMITFIEDREGDIFEQFALIPDEKTHLLIRSRTTRKILDGQDLYSEVESSPIMGTYTIEIPTERRLNRPRRKAEIVLRAKKCKIKRPANLKKEFYPDYLEITCISVQEVTENVTDPISWKLLTTHQVSSYQDALQIVEWYGARWYIEQVFRILKHKGFGIEDSQLESGWAVRKLVLMQMSVLLKILQMNIAYNQEEGQPIEEVFNQEEVKALDQMNKKLAGKTEKTKNLNDPKLTTWAAWVIGRMGGWKGYHSQGPPGVITMKKGIERLAYIIEGIRLARDVCTE